MIVYEKEEALKLQKTNHINSIKKGWETKNLTKDNINTLNHLFQVDNWGLICKAFLYIFGFGCGCLMFYAGWLAVVEKGIHIIKRKKIVA